MMNNEVDNETSGSTKIAPSTSDASTEAASEKTDDTINLVVGKQTTQTSNAVSSGEPSNSGLATPLRQALHAAAALATVTEGIGCPVPIPEIVDVSQNSFARPESTTNRGEISNQNIRETTLHNTITSKPRATAILPAIVTHQQSSAAAVAGAFPMNVPTLAMAYHQPINTGIPMHLPALGAPGAIPPGSFHQLAAAIKASEVPPVFRDKPQRSGKWTREEEEYAELLIELFEKGHINEKNGCTLRSFLSRKLHCAPMRISKKYAGKGIGKMVFLSKCNFRGMGDGIGSPAYHANMQRLRQAESTFYKSCIPELNVQMVIPLSTAISPPYGVLGPSHHIIHSGLPPIAPSPGVAPAFEPSKMILAPQQLPGSSTVWLTVNHGTSTVASGPSGPSQAPTGTFSEPQAPRATTKSQLNAHQSLEQAYISVAKVVSNEMSQPTVDMFNNKLLFPGANNCRDRELVPEPERKHDINGTMKLSHSTPLPTVNQPTNPQYARDHHGNSQAPNNQFPNSQNVSYLDDLPDFLAGFDKISQQNTPNSPQTFDPAQFSPTYTSRSFDDLHRLLGKNLSPEVRPQTVQTMQSSVVKDLLVPSPSVCTITGRTSLLPSQSTGALTSDRTTISFPSLMPKVSPHRQAPQHAGQSYSEVLSGTGDAFGADAYSIFAQQSAVAASQHSAYIRAPSNSDDGMMMLLGDDFEINYPSFNEGTQDHGAAVVQSQPYAVGYQPSSRFTTMVSEPSDHGSDETQGDSFGSGTDNPTDGVSSSNDSDGSYSESSRRKKARSSHRDYDQMQLSFHNRSTH